MARATEKDQENTMKRSTMLTASLLCLCVASSSVQAQTSYDPPMSLTAIANPSALEGGASMTISVIAYDSDTVDNSGVPGGADFTLGLENMSGFTFRPALTEMDGGTGYASVTFYLYAPSSQGEHAFTATATDGDPYPLSDPPVYVTETVTVIPPP